MVDALRAFSANQLRGTPVWTHAEANGASRPDFLKALATGDAGYLAHFAARTIVNLESGDRKRAESAIGVTHDALLVGHARPPAGSFALELSSKAVMVLGREIVRNLEEVANDGSLLMGRSIAREACRLIDAGVILNREELTPYLQQAVVSECAADVRTTLGDDLLTHLGIPASDQPVLRAMLRQIGLPAFDRHAEERARSAANALQPGASAAGFSPTGGSTSGYLAAMTRRL